MLKLLSAAAVLATMTLSAAAQNPSTTAPQATGPNSGAGVQGMPGNKSGPAAPRGDKVTGSSSPGEQQQNAVTRQQDPSKIPGKPGSKSGPAERTPSSAPNR